MSLSIQKVPTAVVDAGMFQLPIEFDQERYAAHWILEDRVPYMEQRQSMPGTGYTVDGLKVWKGKDGKSEPTVRITENKKKYVLMHRSQKVQRQINAIYGNVSKTLLNREVLGQTVQGSQKQDAGILTEADLRGRDGVSMADESVMHLNEIEPNEPIPA